MHRSPPRPVTPSLSPLLFPPHPFISSSTATPKTHNSFQSFVIIFSSRRRRAKKIGCLLCYLPTLILIMSGDFQDGEEKVEYCKRKLILAFNYVRRLSEQTFSFTQPRRIRFTNEHCYRVLQSAFDYLGDYLTNRVCCYEKGGDRLGLEPYMLTMWFKFR